MNLTTDVIIIGDGLAGLTSALHLQQAGINVTLIKKNAYPHHKVCGEYISNEVLPYLAWLNLDVGKRKGYLQKVFTPKEQLQILNSSNPNNMVWLFWSMKDAVYKIVNRETSARFYSPQKFECKLACSRNGEVMFNDQTYFTKSEITEKNIHTIATTHTDLFASIEQHLLPQKENYLANFNAKSKFLLLKKDCLGHPYMINLINQDEQYASISHHGQYLAVIHGIKKLN